MKTIDVPATALLIGLLLTGCGIRQPAVWRLERGALIGSRGHADLVMLERAQQGYTVYDQREAAQGVPGKLVCVEYQRAEAMQCAVRQAQK